MAPLPWVRKIVSHLRDYDEIPLFGKAALFDWEALATALAYQFGAESISITAEEQSWRTADQLQEGLGDSVWTIPLQLGPLEGSAFWMMSQESVELLSGWLMTGQPQAKPIRSEMVVKGFYRFSLLKAIDTLSTLPPLNELNLVMSEASPLPATDAFCIDIAIRMGKRVAWGRLALEPALQKSWKKHFEKSTERSVPPALAQSIELTAGIQVGRVMLPAEEWETLQPGDFVLLDQGSYDRRHHKGAAYWMVGNTPLFQVEIKHNQIKLLDYATAYEEPTEKVMNRHTPPDDSGEEGSVSLQQTPLLLTVEIARLKVTLEKLLQLTPGNLLEIPIDPDQRVHLTVNGQIVGHAELVHLGEALGLRILDLG